MSLDIKKPLVSVIVPCYNHEGYVQDCIKSVIDQDYVNIELIVIDDGSKDNSVSKIEELRLECEKRFVRFEFIARQNKGLCATLNEAIGLSNGYFISPIASDDVMYKEKISKQVLEFFVRYNKNPALVAIYSGVEYIDIFGNKTSVKYGSNKFCGFKEVILRTEFLPTPTFMVMKEKIQAVGGFNENFTIEDFHIRLLLTDHGGVFYVMREPLVKYRRHGDNLSKKSDVIWAGVESILAEYKDRDIYKKAHSKSMMVQAHDYQAIKSPKAALFIKDALKEYPFNFFTISFFKYIIKAIISRGRFK